MSMDILKQDIQNKKFRKIYYFYGEENYLKRFYLDELKNAIFPSEDEKADLLLFDGSELTKNELSDALSSLPMIAENKVVQINDLLPTDEAAQYLVSHGEELEDGVVVIIYNFTVKADERTKAAADMRKFVSENGLCVDCSPLDLPTLRRWVAQQVRKNGGAIDAETVSYLLSQTSHEMDFLYNEIKKLASYGDGTVTRETVDLLAVKTIDARTYDVTDAIFEHDRTKAFLTLKKISDMRTNGMMVLGAIFSSVTSVYKVSLLESEGISTGEIARITGMKDFAVNKAISRAHGVKKGGLEKALRLCTEADLASKTTVSDVEIIISELVTELMNVL